MTTHVPVPDYEVEASEALARWDVPAPVSGSTPPTRVVAIGLHKYQGVLYFPGQQYDITDPADVAALIAREAIHVPAAAPVRWWDAPGRVLSPFETADRVRCERETLGALKIVAGVGYDPGCAGYRLHTALNVHSKHASAFVRFGDSNPYCSLRQYDGASHALTVRDLLTTADVVHCHVSYLLVNNVGMPPRPDQVLVMHYHGSRPDGAALCDEKIPKTDMRLIEWDRLRGAHVVGARLSLVEEIRAVCERLSLPIVPEWMPITVDVDGYRALQPIERRPGPFRIAHSPTERSFKGTSEFRRVVARLQAKGLAVEAVLIENRQHGDALKLKADCDAVFDSFWLGMQGSGLEGAAMGLPVIAGDPTVRALHQERFGCCPYTYANDERALEDAIEQLVVDEAWRDAEARRVSHFVLEHHDYPVVARRYEELLAQWTGRSNVRTVRTPQKRRTRGLEARP